MTGSTVSIRLRAFRGEDYETTECYNGLRIEAAGLIDRLLAERDALKELLSDALDDYIKLSYGAGHEDVAAHIDFRKRCEAALRGEGIKCE